MQFKACYRAKLAFLNSRTSTEIDIKNHFYLLVNRRHIVTLIKCRQINAR